MNWTGITSTDIDESKDPDVIAAAVDKGFNVDAKIAEIVAKIRAACSTGNQLDVDTSKIPNSLKDLAIRIVMRAAKGHLEYPLTQDERDDRAEDKSYLNRISDQKLRFEAPDNPGGKSEMQGGPMIETVQDGNSGNSREDLNRL